MIAKDYVPPWARGDFDYYQVTVWRSITSLGAQQRAVWRWSFPSDGLNVSRCGLGLALDAVDFNAVGRSGHRRRLLKENNGGDCNLQPQILAQSGAA